MRDNCNYTIIPRCYVGCKRTIWAPPLLFQINNMDNHPGWPQFLAWSEIKKKCSSRDYRGNPVFLHPVIVLATFFFNNNFTAKMAIIVKCFSKIQKMSNFPCPSALCFCLYIYLYISICLSFYLCMCYVYIHIYTTNMSFLPHYRVFVKYWGFP